MAKFIKKWRGACKGEIHATEYEPGNECPPELESAAAEMGAIEGSEAPVKKAAAVATAATKAAK
ncbi:hypothetical protein [Paraburkholderia sp. J8-2]|uniref:hypothetical protein n=1 Tax=Paraburkholderia sp. J8-2 TaxID=2805440 RepID=UPI002AB7B50A|nr:hypothetical protein [Paraburkholderia sp. J8-2]